MISKSSLLFVQIFSFLIWDAHKTNAFQNNPYQYTHNQVIPYLSSLVNFCISWNMNILCWCAGEAIGEKDNHTMIS